MRQGLVLLLALLLAGCAADADNQSAAHHRGFYGATSGGVGF